MTVVSQANPILGDLLKATESSSILVPSISAWPVASPLQSPFPNTTASTLSYGLGTSFWSQSLPDHTSVHSSEDCALLPLRLKMHHECNWCAPAAMGCGDQTIAGPKDISPWCHQLLTNCFAPLLCAYHWDLCSAMVLPPFSLPAEPTGKE